MQQSSSLSQQMALQLEHLQSSRMNTPQKWQVNIQVLVYGVL
jgi:hypothetical protein